MAQPGRRRHGHHADRPAVVRRARGRLPHRRFARPTCYATASSTRSLTTTRWCSRWSTRAGSAPTTWPCTPSGRCCCARWTAGRSRSPTCPYTTARRATATCCARTACPAWSATRRCGTRWRRSRILDAAARQLIELAIHGGGPDNITCIVADVVDTATTRLPRTTVGAGRGRGQHDRPGLADGTGPLRGLTTPPRSTGGPRPSCGDDLDPLMTSAVMPLTVSENGADPDAAGQAQPPARSPGDPGVPRRRWPIVTTALVVLVAVVIGGGYVFWRVSQGQYYVGHEQQRPGRHLPRHQPAHRRLQLVQPLSADRDPAGRRSRRTTSRR